MFAEAGEETSFWSIFFTSGFHEKQCLLVHEWALMDFEDSGGFFRSPGKERNASGNP
jgi:hypothetical protein